MAIVSSAFKKSSSSINILFLLLCIALFLYGSAVWLAEQSVSTFDTTTKQWFSLQHGNVDAGQLSSFQSIPASWWWAVATLTTVGYGDAVPVSAVGRFIGGIAMLNGVLLLAFPIVMLGGSFQEAQKMHRQRQLRLQEVKEQRDAWVAKYIPPSGVESKLPKNLLRHLRGNGGPASDEYPAEEVKVHIETPPDFPPKETKRDSMDAHIEREAEFVNTIERQQTQLRILQANLERERERASNLREEIAAEQEKASTLRAKVVLQDVSVKEIEIVVADCRTQRAVWTEEKKRLEDDIRNLKDALGTALLGRQPTTMQHRQTQTDIAELKYSGVIHKLQRPRSPIPEPPLSRVAL